MSDPPTTLPEQTGGVTDPAKLLRVASMARELLDVLRDTTLGEPARARLDGAYRHSLDELRDALGDDLRGELERLARPLLHDPAPSEAELRVAEAQLVGWLQGVFHGMQASAALQQAATLAAPQPPAGIPGPQDTSYL